MPLFLLFIILPIVELTLILKFHGLMAQNVGSELSTWISIGIILFTGVMGAKYAKKQGKQVLGELQQNLALGRTPNESLLKGFMVLLGGALLLTPGYLTDVFGLSLLFPLTQKIWSKKILQYFQSMQNSGRVHFSFGFPGRMQDFQSHQNPNQTAKQKVRIDPEIIDVPASDWKENQ